MSSVRSSVYKTATRATWRRDLAVHVPSDPDVQGLPYVQDATQRQAAGHAVRMPASRTLHLRAERGQPSVRHHLMPVRVVCIIRGCRSIDVILCCRRRGLVSSYCACSCSVKTWRATPHNEMRHKRSEDQRQHAERSRARHSNAPSSVRALMGRSSPHVLDSIELAALTPRVVCRNRLLHG